MFDQSQGVVISWDEYFQAARKKLFDECCLPDEALAQVKANSQMNGIMVVHVRTRNEENVVASYPGYNRLYKHVFLQNPTFKKEIIEYYKGKGFSWVDIYPLNRVDWKIFLTEAVAPV